MEELHNLLKSQMRKKFGTDEVPGDLEGFINAVNKAYKQNDIDREILERSLAVSSNEFNEIIFQLKRANSKLIDYIKNYHTKISRAYPDAEFDFLFQKINNMDDFQDYDLNEAVKNTLLIVNDNIEKDVKVNLELSELPTIKALGEEIDQVLLNLIINAVYSIKEGEEIGSILIKTYHNEDFVTMEIRDSGTGINPDHMSRIFQPFFTTKSEEESSGLGLSIAYDIIVNKHKGKIDVFSEVGAGSTFVIQIPINILME